MRGWNPAEGVCDQMIDPNEVGSKYREYADNPDNKKGKLILKRPFPFERFNVYCIWRPVPVKLLLVGESPPADKYPINYFYNAKYRGKLSTAVLDDLLRIRGEKKECQLNIFKNDLHYMLIDTIMCAVDGRIPQELVEFSGKHLLKNEVERLKPHCILALGNVSLEGLKTFEPFKTCLADVDSAVRKEKDGKMAPLISRDCGGTHIVVSPFPSRFRNKNNWWQVEEAFREAVRVAKTTG